MEKKYRHAVRALNSGEAVVMPADTIYGIFAVANSPKAIENLYKIRKREAGKSCIVLVDKLGDLALFDVTLSKKMCAVLDVLWSDTKPLRQKENYLKSLYPKEKITLKTHAISIILPCAHEKNAHICRGRKDIAVRVPSARNKKGQKLREVLKKTGPLIAPSANPAGKKPAQTVEEAKKYFGDKIKHYISYGRKIDALPSHVIVITEKKIIQLR